VQPLVEAFYELDGNGAGGSLHVVLDDGNLEDDNIKYCIKYAQERADHTAELLGQVLLQMSPTQRRRV